MNPPTLGRPRRCCSAIAPSIPKLIRDRAAALLSAPLLQGRRWCRRRRLRVERERERPPATASSSFERRRRAQAQGPRWQLSLRVVMERKEARKRVTATAVVGLGGNRDDGAWKKQQSDLELRAEKSGKREGKSEKGAFRHGLWPSSRVGGRGRPRRTPTCLPRACVLLRRL